MQAPSELVLYFLASRCPAERTFTLSLSLSPLSASNLFVVRLTKRLGVMREKFLHVWPDRSEHTHKFSEQCLCLCLPASKSLIPCHCPTCMPCHPLPCHAPNPPERPWCSWSRHSHCAQRSCAAHGPPVAKGVPEFECPLWCSYRNIKYIK